MTPEEFAAYLDAAVIGHMLQAYVYGLGLGLLIKVLNRS